MMMKEEEIKEHLMSENLEFRRLCRGAQVLRGPAERTTESPSLDGAGPPRRNPAQKKETPAQRPNELHDLQVPKRTESSAHIDR